MDEGDRSLNHWSNLLEHTCVIYIKPLYIYVTLDHKTSSRGMFVAIAKNALYGSKLFEWAVLGGSGRVLTFYKEYLFCFETLVFATSWISSMHEQLVTLQRERKNWNRIIWPLQRQFSQYLIFFAPSDYRFSNSCISAKYCPILTNIDQWKAYLFSFQMMYTSQFSKNWPLWLVLWSLVTYVKPLKPLERNFNEGGNP